MHTCQPSVINRRKSCREITNVTVATDRSFSCSLYAPVRCRGREPLSAQITSPTCPAKTTRATWLSSSTQWTASSANPPSYQQTGGVSGWPFPPSPSASQTLSLVWRLSTCSTWLCDQQPVVLASTSLSPFFFSQEQQWTPSWMAWTLSRIFSQKTRWTFQTSTSSTGPEW